MSLLNFDVSGNVSCVTDGCMCYSSKAEPGFVMSVENDEIGCCSMGI